MIKKLAVFILALMAFVRVVNAQYNTGDTQLNASLTVIDNDAKLDWVNFKTDMSSTYTVPETKIDSWVNFGMKAGDIYLTLEISILTKKPADEVVKVYQTNKKKGWGAIAKELGIKPGSPEFHKLKGNADTKAKKGKGGKSSPKPKDTKAKPKTK